LSRRDPVPHSDPFRNIGAQDITAHVDFSALIEDGRGLGLEPVRCCAQGKFLLDEGAELIREIVEHDAGKYSPVRNAIHQLIHPAHMGRAFTALLQRKGGALADDGRPGAIRTPEILSVSFAARRNYEQLTHAAVDDAGEWE
jgi:SAM-dependent MidA family methyltransferase